MRKIWNKVLIKIKYIKTRIKSEFISSDAIIDRTVVAPRDSWIFGGEIGRYTYLGHGTGIFNGVIGQFCSIGNFVMIGGYQHPYKKMSTSPRLYREILGELYDDSNHDVVIGNDVWIGDGAVILKGKIGDGAIIGANAVVTSDIPSYAIAVGCPAKVTKYRFNKEKIDYLQSLKWWNWDISKIRQDRKIFD